MRIRAVTRNRESPRTRARKCVWVCDLSDGGLASKVKTPYCAVIENDIRCGTELIEVGDELPLYKSFRKNSHSPAGIHRSEFRQIAFSFSGIIVCNKIYVVIQKIIFQGLRVFLRYSRWQSTQTGNVSLIYGVAHEIRRESVMHYEEKGFVRRNDILVCGGFPPMRSEGRVVRQKRPGRSQGGFQRRS